VRILVNRSNGRGPELAAIARLHEGLDADPDAFVRVKDAGPGRVVVRIDGTAADDPSRVHGYLTEAKAAGVRLQTVTVPEPYTRLEAFRLVTPAYATAHPNSLVGLADVALGRGAALCHVLDS
jgi:hypothetical protein